MRIVDGPLVNSAPSRGSAESPAGPLISNGGAPSTSPFSTWINDPREPEDLPKGWAPDTPPHELLPDEPPF